MRVVSLVSSFAVIASVFACSSSDSSSSSSSGGATDGGGASGGNKAACSGRKPFLCESQAYATSTEADQGRQTCTNEGHQAASSCPSADLIGCCTQLGSFESCYYTGYGKDATKLQSDCTAGQGTWATTP